MNPPNTPLRLGVNVDHVATLRQQRGTRYPSPLAAAFVAQSAGADGITVHLREDRRHIQEQDVRELCQAMSIPVNLEIALDEKVLRIAEDVRPHAVCIVPERREELTTEGGLDVVTHHARIQEACQRLSALGCRVSLFIEAEDAQLDAAIAAGAQAIEIHTGKYVLLDDPADQGALVQQFARIAQKATAAGLEVHAGHGLHIENLTPIARIPQIVELNIGHSIVGDAVLMGMAAAVARMKSVMMHARARPAVRSAI